MTKRPGPAQRRTCVILAASSQDPDIQWDCLTLGNDAEIVQFRVVNRSHFYDDSPDRVGSHLQSSPDLGFRRPFPGVVSNPAIRRDRSSEQLTRTQGVTGTRKGVQGMVERSHLFGSQARDAAV